MTTNPDIETDIPPAIYGFFRLLNRALDNHDTGALNDLYEVQFDAHTRDYYVVGPGQFRHWPSPRLAQVSNEFRNRPGELIYSFLYHKHLFTDRSVKQSDAKSAWATFTDLFNALPEGTYELPNKMLWDIFDEFVFQMSVVYQKRFSGVTEWGIHETFRQLNRVVVESNVLEALRQPELVEELTKGIHTRTLCGYFAIIAKAKINVLLGDYYAALSELEKLDIYGGSRSILQKVSPAHISLLYYIGFSYLMLHRYEDASNSFRRCLSLKASGRKFSERVQLDAAYMFVCARVLGGMVVSNISYYMDTRKVASFEDDKESLRSGDEDRFREVFDRCSPKFLAVPPLSSSVKGTEGKELQARMFRRAVQQQQQIVKLRGYFGVYQNTKMSLLEKLLDIDDAYAPLFALKMRSRQLVHDGESANLLSGEYKVSSQYDCVVNDDSVEMVACTTFGGAEAKLFNKIKALNRDKEIAQRKQAPSRQRREGTEQRRPNRPPRGMQPRGNMNNGNGQQGGRGGAPRNGQPRGAATRNEGAMRRAVVQPGNNLFNRNEV